jgi:hypothetical protein
MARKGQSAFIRYVDHSIGRIASTTLAASILLSAASPPEAIAAPADQPPTISDDGNVTFAAARGNEIIGLTTKLTVPPLPPATGTLFLWPGLQPDTDGRNFLPIDNGVLQPVLTWGPSCAPGQKGDDPYSTWWISGQYVNDYGGYTGYGDPNKVLSCFGGPIMSVKPGDTLLIRISVYQAMWTQTVLDLQSKESVSFHISLRDQAQIYAWFTIEPYDKATISDITFTETTISFATPDSNNCQLIKRGKDDVVTTPIPIYGGEGCYIEKIVLKAPPTPVVADRSCRQEGVIKSADSRHSATISVKNDHGSPVRVYRIDDSGHRALQSTLESGQSVTQQTDRTHAWVVADQSDKCLKLLLPRNQPAVFAIQ